MPWENSDRADIFLENYRDDLPDHLIEIKKYAEENHIPIMGNHTADILRFFIRTIRPQKILEIGTAIGYSALYMSECAEKKAKITTVELMEKRYIIAEKNFEKYDDASAVTLIKKDAAIVLKTLCDENEKFGVIFLDAAKGQYPSFLESLIELLEPGGVLVTDNIFHNGAVLDSRYAASQRDRTIHDRLRQYLKMLFEKKELETVTIPIDDGVTITKKCK